MQGNIGDIIYLKSTDDTMLSTLQDLSGTKYEASLDSRSVRYKAKNIINPVDQEINETTTDKSKPVVSKNDMLLMPRGNALVFNSEVGYPNWNRGPSAMPYAYTLLDSHRLKDLSGEGLDKKGNYSQDTVPVPGAQQGGQDLLLKNIPNFTKIVKKRVDQARLTPKVVEKYKEAHNLTDFDLHQMDSDELAKDLMIGINDMLKYNQEQDAKGKAKQNALNKVVQSDDSAFNELLIQDSEAVEDDDPYRTQAQENEIYTNTRASQEVMEAQETATIYAQGTVSKNMLRNDHQTGLDLATAYGTTINLFKNDPNFVVDKAGNLFSSNHVLYISSKDDELAKMEKEADDDSNDSIERTQTGGKNVDADDEARFEVQPAFIKYLLKLPNWNSILNGRFDKAVYQAHMASENRTADNQS